MNLVMLTGRLTKNPELRTTESGKNVATFNLAVNRFGSEEADFISCRVWGNQADNLVKYQSKGSLVAVNGSYRVETYKNKDGDTRYNYYVLANSIEYLSKKEEPKEERKTPAKSAYEEFANEMEIRDEDLPF